MNDEVFFSLLALDSYNQGYRESVLGIGFQIGEAEVIGQSVIAPDSNQVGANFYAIAYDWNGQTIISFRGTDEPFNFQSGGDLWTGWTIGAGFIVDNSQALYAVEFYETTAQQVSEEYRSLSDRSIYDGYLTNIVTTGHSLGGGLAGFTGALGGTDSYGFDHMPFGYAAGSQAITDAFNAAVETVFEDLGELLTIDTAISLLIAGPITGANTYAAFVDAFIAELAYHAPDLETMRAYNLQGEILGGVRTVTGQGIEPGLAQLVALFFDVPEITAALNALGYDTETPESFVDQNEVSNFGASASPSNLSVMDLHSQALLTITLFGEKEWGTADSANGSWRDAYKYFASGLMSDEIGSAIGLTQFAGPESPGTGNGLVGAQMTAMIAYSLLEAGDNSTLVFGDSGIRALLDDGDDFGEAITSNLLPSFVDEDVRLQIGNVMAEFAGLLAYKEITQASWSEATNGVLEKSNGLSIDLTDTTWQLNGALGQVHESVAAANLVEEIAAAALGTSVGRVQADFVTDQLEGWLNSNHQSTGGSAFNAVDEIVFSLIPGKLVAAEKAETLRLFVGTDQGESVAINGGVPAIVIAGGGADTIIGTDGADALVGGKGNDVLVGGSGNDWFHAGIGSDTIYGDAQDGTGSGHDTIVYKDSGTVSIFYNGLGDRPVINVANNDGPDALYEIEQIKVEASKTIFSIAGDIAAETNLVVSAFSQDQILNLARLDHGGAVSISRGSGFQQIANTESGGAVLLQNFNTEIIGSKFDDQIVDLSDEEKFIDGGNGDDIISVEGTMPDSVLSGGDGADRIIGGAGNDVIIDRNTYTPEATSFDSYYSTQPGSLEDQLREALGDELTDPTFNWGPEFGLGAIDAGAGDDTIVISAAEATPLFVAGSLDDITATIFGFVSPGSSPGEDQFFLIDPGTGQDRIQIDFANAGVHYRYEAGDGNDSISVRNYADFGYSDSTSISPDRTFAQATFVFDLAGYTEDDVTVAFSEQSSQLIWEDRPNLDLSPLYLVKGDFVISLADGGSITINDFYGFRVGEGTVTSGLALSFSELSGPPADPEYPSNPPPPGPDPSDPPPPDPDPTDPPADPSPPTNDQTELLSPGNKTLTGGSGLDQLIVTWSLETISASLDQTELAITDKWGVLGTTTVTDFDEIYVVSENATYTPQGFVARLAELESTDDVYGDDQDNVINGTDLRDRIFGEEGADTINGLGENDELHGGIGADTIDGGTGDDRLLGGEGDDTLTGGEGDDTLVGGAGLDTMSGGLGNDTYVIDDVGDVVIELADEGRDRIEVGFSYALGANLEDLELTDGATDGTGNAEDNSILGNSANNVLVGLGGDDALIGSSGDDDLDGGEGNDVLRGGADNDDLTGGLGDDSLNGGSGTDRAIYAGNSTDYQITRLFTGETIVAASGPSSLDGIDNLINIETILFEGDNVVVTIDTLPQYGTELADTIVMNDTSSSLFALGGDDTVVGGDSNDIIYGGKGNDAISGGDRNDILDGGEGDDTLAGEGQNDTLIGGEGFDTALYAGTANDYSIYFEIDGSLTVSYRLRGSNEGQDSLTEIEALYFAADPSTLLVKDITPLGTEFADYLIGSTRSDTLFGLGDNDSLFGDEGHDFLDGGGGADKLRGGLGDDTLTGGADADVFVVGDGFGTDTITDFDIAVDTVDFATTVFADFSAIQAASTQDGSDVLITAGSNSLRLLNINLGDLASSHFTFAGNITPDAVDDGPFSTAYQTDIDIDVSQLLANDIDADGDPINIVSVQAAVNGAVVIDGTAVTFTPDAGFSGQANFTYTLSDGFGGTDIARVDLTVDAPPNTAPIGFGDIYTVSEDAVLSVNTLASGVLANDNDAENDTLNVTLVADVINGSLVLNSDGTFVYTPNTNFNGTDSFTYSVSDGTASDGPVTVSISVTADNDAPIGAADSYISIEDTVLTIDALSGVLANDSDIDGDILTVSLNTDASGGTVILNADGSFDYTPNADFSGADSFTYNVSDGTVSTGLVTVSIAVAAINDDPMGAADAYTVTEDQVLSVTDYASGVLANDGDADGDTLTASLVGDVSSGTLVLNSDGTFGYTPNANFNGTDSFSYALSDGTKTTSPIVVDLTVTADNDAPAGASDSYAATEDTVLAIGPLSGVLANDGDIDGDALTVAIETDVSNGTLVLNADGSFDYTPNADFNGTDSYTYNVSDGTDTSGPVTVSITVAPANDNPTAVADAYVTTADTPLNITALAGVLANDSDVDGDALTATLGTAVSNGTLVLNADGSFAYTPNAGFSGTDSFTYTASDGQTSSLTQTVTLTISQSSGGILNGTSGNDLLQGTSGNDTITGYTGADVFVISSSADGQSDGVDTITDFTAGEDTVELNGIARKSVDYIQTGNDTSVVVDGIQIALFENTDASDVLRGTDFDGSPSLTRLIIGGVEQNLVTIGTENGDNIGGAPGITNHIIGLGGDDILSGRGKPDILDGGAGNDQLLGSNSNDQLFGGDDDDLLTGGNGKDLLEGGAGDDILEGGRGDDTLQGGAGIDQFLFSSNFGDDVIIDFEVGIDLIDFDGAGFADFNALSAAMTDTARGVLIDDGNGNTILLNGLVVADFSASDFLFA